jgi:hypothetical protein
MLDAKRLPAFHWCDIIMNPGPLRRGIKESGDLYAGYAKKQKPQR